MDIEWVWDEMALIIDANVLNLASGDDAIFSEPFTLTNPLSTVNTLNVASVNAQQVAYVFNVDGTDECDNLIISNASISPFITGSNSAASESKSGTSILSLKYIIKSSSKSLIFI